MSHVNKNIMVSTILLITVRESVVNSAEYSKYDKSTKSICQLHFVASVKRSLSLNLDSLDVYIRKDHNRF